MSKHPDPLGDRIKAYETIETSGRFIPTIPICARIDGRSFSKFTKGMDRPYDQRMSDAMIRTASMLVDHTHALIGYTQSDEITLVWCAESYKSDIFFSGKKQKMVSVLASLATAYFTRALIESESDLMQYVSKMPHFDTRVFQLPSREEAANAVLWRERDATKNAVSMSASHYYSHKQLHGKSGSEMQEMLFQKGVNFNDYPAFFKRGTFVRRVTELKTLSESERMKIPEKNRPPERQEFERSSVKIIDMPPFDKVSNREAVIFDAAAPLVYRTQHNKKDAMA